VDVKKIRLYNERTPQQIADGNYILDEWYVDLDPDFKPKREGIANNERDPTFEPSPLNKQNCFHPLRRSCDCGVPPAYLVDNALMANCSSLVDGSTCELKCKKKYVALGQFECFKGAYKDPLPQCVRAGTEFNQVTALAQTVTFEVKRDVDAEKWKNATEEALPRTVSFFTSIDLEDIVVHKVNVAGRRRLGSGEVVEVDFDEATASASAAISAGDGVVTGSLTINTP
jgi:hypothetical protein